MQEKDINKFLMSVNNFKLNATHNGVSCIMSLKSEDIGTANQYWVSIKMLASNFEVSKDLILKRIKILEKRNEFNPTLDVGALNIPDDKGRIHLTPIYNLTVLNKLAMTFIDNDKAQDFRDAFNDIIVKHETMSIQPVKQTVNEDLPVPQTFSEALRLAAYLWDQVQNTTKALDAEKEQHEKDNADFCEYVDILNQKKAEIGTRREATAMNTASQKSKECKRLTNVNKNLTCENDKLKDEIGFGSNWKQATAIDWYDEFFVKKRDSNFYSQCGRILTQISKELGIEVKKVQDTKYTKNCYYIAVVDEFRNRLENGCEYSRIKQYYKADNSIQKAISLF
jgi:hypothetical protein